MAPTRATAPFTTLASTQELFRADGLTLNSNSDTVTANVKNQLTNQVGGVIDVSAVSNGLLIVNVGSVAGSSPGLAVFFDVQDAFGNWVLTSNPTAISGVVLGFATPVWGNISTGYNLTLNGRIRWVVTGTGSPVFSGVSFSLFGR
ncbi:hypothetical protein OG455_41230 [Kitasatospora sp. NBC_01287]|uniref:hypothetical protein n=1 Tax=Kitasatospora sp. NBC_01287 TaxID=2903573 RepID=UPI002255B14B|nr:hypothetical protein [Kitasatospora sp. NBC_01287]MCX4750906.1 hypothetical protein [Kitasatospora sp. NBC_01287]MCX4751865.1 hypothetical protein [Kitasatospora sp. NBC_01287]